ncbi:MAG: hypothetical protein HWQ35_22275 [Nostoc sp. NMS1]|uniref:hypothetical protein n=1 Tax=unclassified Nostoc TaxID=2593658 RepID=UPI0025D74C5F|nr:MULTISPECIES: hypothetical protein [unclassified Nostoc]MBN3909181.1 hypothetical protein [Nostoc sp. NMS1]MBN3990372.1 hypothetical protein [Nostoc sp. NMS2]
MPTPQENLMQHFSFAMPLQLGSIFYWKQTRLIASLLLIPVQTRLIASPNSCTEAINRVSTPNFIHESSGN